MFLLSSTVPSWTEAARADLPALLCDHLHCERKAVENALQLVRRYADRPGLVEARSHERLLLLGRAFAAAGDAETAGVYEALASAEERHFELFYGLACEVAPAEAPARARELGEREAAIIASLPHGPRIH